MDYYQDLIPEVVSDSSFAVSDYESCCMLHQHAFRLPLASMEPRNFEHTALCISTSLRVIVGDSHAHRLAANLVRERRIQPIARNELDSIRRRSGDSNGDIFSREEVANRAESASVRTGLLRRKGEVVGVPL